MPDSDLQVEARVAAAVAEAARKWARSREWVEDCSCGDDAFACWHHMTPDEQAQRRMDALLYELQATVAPAAVEVGTAKRNQLQQEVFGWLGFWRDKLPAGAVAQLQLLLGEPSWGAPTPEAPDGE